MAMKSYRISRMEQYIIDHEHVSMEELCTVFDISINTARLDIQELVKKGSIRKVYGGVMSKRANALVPFEERKNVNSDTKRSICHDAAAIVEDGDIIFIDSGSTAMYIVDFLQDRKNVTVITNNLNAIVRAVQLPNINLFALPGTLDRRTNSFITADTAKTISRFNIKKAFIAAAGISENGEISNSSPLEYEVKRAAIQHSAQKYLVLDSSKYGKTSLMNFAGLTEMNGIFTDTGIDHKLLKYCEYLKVEFTLANPVSNLKVVGADDDNK